MKKNIGNMDRVLRLIAGAAVIALGYMGGLESPWNIVAMGAGAVFVLTALISFCPLYGILGLNTCGCEKSD